MSIKSWKNKSLEVLENDFWKDTDFPTRLVEICYKLRKKPLKDFEVEDLRIMIGQNIGLKYLIPLAIEVLISNILAKGNYYEGDLLHKVLISDAMYWKEEKSNWKTVCDLFRKNWDKLENFEYSQKDWFINFNTFEKINI